LCGQCLGRLTVTKGLCNRCYQAKRYKDKPQSYFTSQRSWYQGHRDEQIARARVYHSEHPAKIKASRRAYYFKNQDHINAASRAYYAAHREEIRMRRRPPRDGATGGVAN